jgi:hypothetical protein
MAIVPVPYEKCKSLKEFLEKGGEIEVPRPKKCLNEKCGLAVELRTHGSYMRQVFYWGAFFLVRIHRFRCHGCGRTQSCPYSWLVPYCRFSAEVIATAITEYADSEVSYRDLSISLSDPEFVGVEQNIWNTSSPVELSKLREESVTSEAVDEAPSEYEGASLNESMISVQRPAFTTVWYWLSFICKRSERLLQRMQKELAREMKRRGQQCQQESLDAAENPNKWKALSSVKAEALDLVSQCSVGIGNIVIRNVDKWIALRAYFLAKAETCEDILTRMKVYLQSTHTFELDF